MVGVAIVALLVLAWSSSGYSAEKLLAMERNCVAGGGHLITDISLQRFGCSTP